MAQAAARADLDDISDETMARKTYLKPNQRQELNESIARNEAALLGYAPNGQPMPAVPGIQAPDAAMLRENISRDRAMLEAGTPPTLTELQIRKRILRVQELDTDIKRGMPSIDQMWRPLAPHVDACIAHSRHNKTRILARKSLLSEIDPGNEEPNFRSVELLRTNDPPTVDLRQYWRNADLIQWKKDAELLQEQEIGEETFARFCMLKLADWAKVSIRRELALSEIQYEQAMKRAREMKAQAPQPAQEEHPSEEELEDHPSPSEGEQSAALGDRPLMRPAPPEDAPSFGMWLNREIQRRRIVKRAFADQMKMDTAHFSNRLKGKKLFSLVERQQALEILGQFDAGTCPLKQHEMIPA